MVVSFRCSIRWVGVAASCGVSVAAGLGLVFRLVTPESITHLGTPELLGLLALLVMPVAVLAAMRAHRTWALHAPSVSEGPIEAAETGAADLHPIVVLAPDVRNRSADRHRRRLVHRRRTAA